MTAPDPVSLDNPHICDLNINFQCCIHWFNKFAWIHNKTGDNYKNNVIVRDLQILLLILSEFKLIN